MVESTRKWKRKTVMERDLNAKNANEVKSSVPTYDVLPLCQPSNPITAPTRSRRPGRESSEARANYGRAT